MKGVVSQKESEIKKLKESLDIRNKRISILETQIHEANKTIMDSAVNLPKESDNDMNLKLLEERTKSIEAQVKILMLNQNSKSTDRLNYHCEYCDKIFNCKDTINEHKELKHKTTPLLQVRAKPQVFVCDMCDFESDIEYRFESHLKTVHKLKCEQCSYHGTHEKDLQQRILL